MARKQSSSSSELPLNRKHVSRAQREAQQRQRVVVGTIVVAVLVALVLVGGALFTAFVEPGQAMAEVNGETITRRDFYERVNYERFRIYQVARETREQYEENMSDPQTASFMGQFFQQQLSQLGQIYGQVGSQTYETMIEELVIEEEAERRGISVTDEEVETEVRRQIARQEGAQIEVDVTATSESRAALTATAALFTPTPEPTPTEAVEATESAGDEDEDAEGTPEAETTESAGDEDEDAEATPEAEATESDPATPAPTFTPAPTLTPNILAQDTFETRYQEFLAEMERRTGFNEAKFRRVIRLQALREKLSEAIKAETEVETSEEQVHAAHILVETEEEAQQVIERLDEGEDFAAVAAEVSTDTSNNQDGGDLGWFGRGQMVAAFEEAAFALEGEGTLSEPIQTTFGWHVIKLLEGPEERELSEEDIEAQRNEAFQTFLQEAKSEETITRSWNFEDLPSDPFLADLSRPLPTPPATFTPEVPVTTSTPVGAEAPDAVETPATDE